jgi:hypothetical protein
MMFSVSLESDDPGSPEVFGVVWITSPITGNTITQVFETEHTFDVSEISYEAIVDRVLEEFGTWLRYAIRDAQDG